MPLVEFEEVKRIVEAVFNLNIQQKENFKQYYEDMARCASNEQQEKSALNNAVDANVKIALLKDVYKDLLQALEQLAA
jgi:hypothetical protein